MDGDGPAGGRVRDVGLLAASTDGVALDAVMCAVAGLDAEWVPTLAAARKRGIGVVSLAGIEVLGIPMEEAGGRVSPFVYSTTYRLATNSWLPHGESVYFSDSSTGQPSRSSSPTTAPAAGPASKVARLRP